MSVNILSEANGELLTRVPLTEEAEVRIEELGYEQGETLTALTGNIKTHTVPTHRYA